MYLREVLLRFSTESPLFFKIWQYITGFFVIITALPELIDFFKDLYPNMVNTHWYIALSWSARMGLFMSMLTTQSQPEAITIDGKILKSTDGNKLPFTAKHEDDKAQNVDVLMKPIKIKK